MIYIRPYHIQETRQQGFDFFNVPRVDYDALLDQLHFPVVWAYEDTLGVWLPAEADYDFINFLRPLPNTIRNDALPKGRFQQLCRMGLITPPRRTLAEMQEEARSHGIAIIRNLLHPDYCKSMLKSYYYRNEHLHDRWKDLEGIKRTSVNNMPLMRLIHQGTEGLVKAILGEDIKTSYSFASSYESGTTLPAHTDRPQCVYNISFLLGSDPCDARLSDWPFFIKHGELTNRVELEAGDGVLYSGVRDLHWRDMMPTKIAHTLGVFFHYVAGSFTGSLD
ncbi:hypothetical protein SAMN06265795_11124 [Noviherbaspirillum humi]|uniref:Phytanoyl-CoA dioxygenase (PhyH) n=1 Tax=Noviherbaspirillum humi TaxID=1688639 RepID=A0A239IXL5_9BURK|nr:hypothetical protein [Noviherbaspirillum humi]SNS98516.1 hypothetical protein SAMN06265795_11124 [Noviherbaspirillum humi]